MNNITDYDEYKKLLQETQVAAQAYYNTDVETMSDSQYDNNIDRLNFLQKTYGWDEADALLNKVAAGQGVTGDVTHSTPMLSLNKANSVKELQKFFNTTTSKKFVLEPKLDGLAISALYKNGILTQVAVRGGGDTGENITAKAKFIKGLPEKISVTDDIEVRGEVFITEEDFYAANMNRLKYGYEEWYNKNLDTTKIPLNKLLTIALSNQSEDKKKFVKGKTNFYPDKHVFSNSRNAAAGVLRKDKQTYSVTLTFSCYEIISHKNFMTYTEKTRFIESLGFTSAVSLIPNVVNQENVFLKKVEIFGELRKNGLPFPTDGVVIKIDDIGEQQRLGSGSKYPRWAIGYKFPSLVKETVVERIEMNIGRTGRLSLRAKVKPVFIDSLISYVSLHNVSWLQEKDIRVGDTVLLRKANDVIPQIDEVVLDKRNSNSQRWLPPEKCFVCGEEWDKTTMLWRCRSVSCGSLNGIIFAADRNYFDWEGLSEAIITALNTQGLVNNIADVFMLSEEELTSLVIVSKKFDPKENKMVIQKRKLGEKNGKKIFAQIQQSKQRPLSAVIAALGIRTLGKTFGKRLEAKYGDMEVIRNLSVEQLTTVEGIATKKAEIIHQGFKDNAALIDSLKKSGVNMVSSKKVNVPSNHVFSGKKIVITGNIPGYTRNEAENLLNSVQAHLSSSVSSSTFLLVADMESVNSSKYKKAKSLNVPIMSPEEFLTKIK